MSSNYYSYCYRIDISGGRGSNRVSVFFVIVVLKPGALLFGEKMSLKRKTSFIRRNVCTLWRVFYSAADLTVP